MPTNSIAASAAGAKMADLPPPLMTSEPESFARQTIVERKPQIIARVIGDNGYPATVVAALTTFRDEIVRDGTAGRTVQPLREQQGDAGSWNVAWAPFEECTWLELPWYFAETYFYRRLLEAVRYFQPGPWFQHDPFGLQKRAQETLAVEQLGAIWPKVSGGGPTERLVALLHGCLWGNRADLSNFTVREQAIGNAAADRANILIDHTPEVSALLAQGLDRVVFVNDNVGADSLFDLALTDHLLKEKRAKQVTFHLKSQPFFVSDALPQDIDLMIDRLSACPTPHLAALGERLRRARTLGALTLATHPFWTSSLGFRHLPTELTDELGLADLVILKGDVNYRRLLDDRHWPPATPLGAITDFFPKPYLILRTLKGEIITGLCPGQAHALQTVDPTWLINGRRGLVQFIAATDG